MALYHPIFLRWPAQIPGRLQIFSLPTPNGVKASIMPEETGIPYEWHRIPDTVSADAGKIGAPVGDHAMPTVQGIVG